MSSSAAAAFMKPAAAIIVGEVAGILVPLVADVLEFQLAVNDPGGAISVHAVGGLWGLLAVALLTDAGAPVGSGMVRIEPSTYSQGKASLGFAKMKWKIVINGNGAALRITEAAPEFWFYFGTGREAFSSGPSSPDDFALVRLERKGKDRELVVGQSGMTGMSAGMRSQDTIALESKQVAPGIYQAKANKPLEPGEYAFTRSGVTMESASTGKVFDFGVDALH